MKSYLKEFVKGLWQEKPVLVLMLGMCPTLAVSSSAKNALGMGLATTAVLAGSNVVISLIRKLIPGKVRIPCYIVVIAVFVTIVQLLMAAYAPELNRTLGIFIPLIVVNCIVLGRAEAFASKHGPVLSLLDGIGMGLGFTIGLTIIGTIREVLGNGSFFGIAIPGYEPMAFFVRAPGAFLVLAILVAIMNASGIKNRANKMTEGCDGCCASCSSSCDKKEG